MIGFQNGKGYGRITDSRLFYLQLLFFAFWGFCRRVYDKIKMFRYREEHPPDDNPMISVFADDIMPQDWSTPLLFVLTDLRLWSEELSKFGFRMGWDCEIPPNWNYS